MKRFLTCLAGLMLAGISLSAQVHEAHLGGGLPMYRILGVEYQRGIESIGPDLSAGYKFLRSWKGGLQWYLGADLYGRTVRFESLWYTGVGQSKPNIAYVMNIPAGTGLRYNFNINENFSAYADFGLGLSLEMGSENTKDGHFINYNLYDGSALENTYDRMEYSKGLSVSNAFSGAISMLIGKEFQSTISSYFTLEFGTVIRKHWLVGVNYANFGVAEVERYQRLQFVKYSPGMDMPSEVGSAINGGSGIVVLSSLSLRFGYLF